mmetsp:Transcript_8991/g.33083  ORF Transcript_8991/g.33083 Transcript_8991/m.33083 type:complete len:339 (+) Transcript_8991:76-1092(+)
MFGPSFKSSTCKTALHMAVGRMHLLKNKKEIQLKQLKKEVAKLLGDNKIDNACIRVELVLQEEHTLSAYEILELYCELVAVRIQLIAKEKLCPVDLQESVASVIYAAPICSEITELSKARTQLTAKYGKEFVNAVSTNSAEAGVNQKLMDLLRVKAPEGKHKLAKLEDIAEEHHVTWNVEVAREILVPEPTPPPLIEPFGENPTASSVQLGYPNPAEQLQTSLAMDPLAPSGQHKFVPFANVSLPPEEVPDMQPTVEDDDDVPVAPPALPFVKGGPSPPSAPQEASAPPPEHPTTEVPPPVQQESVQDEGEEPSNPPTANDLDDLTARLNALKNKGLR